MFLFALPHLLAAAVLASPSPSPSPALPPQITRVVTSDRSDETLRNTVRTTYVVTAAEIARNGYRTVSEALADVPGVEINAYGPIGASAQYGIRGSSSTQTLVLIDGVPAPGGLADSVQLGTIPTTGVARIEIVEGGGSTLYGEGAIGGIINIITDGSTAPPSASISYGTFDDRELHVADHGFSFEHISADNTYEIPSSQGSSGPNPSERSNSDYEENTARYGLDRTLGALGLSLRTSLGNDDVGADGEFPDYSGTSREHDVNEDAALTLTLREAQSAPTATFFGTRQLIAFDCETSDPNCFQNSASLSQEGRTGIDLRNTVTGASERLIYGADLSRGVVGVNDGDGDVTSDALAQSAAYAQETWLGAREEYYAGLRGERDGSLGGEFSPAVGARFSLGDAFTLKLNAATAFRAPDATELYYPNYGNPNLAPERAHVGDATLADDRILGGTSLTWFDNYTRDLIVLEPADNYAPENVDHARLSGFTLSTQTVPMNGIAATLAATDLYAAQDVDAGMRLPDDPVISLSLGLRYTGAPRALVYEAGISERAVGARGALDPTQPSFEQPGAYSNLSAYMRFRVAKGTLLSVRGDNLGNERYAEVAGYPMPGRTLRIDLSSSGAEHRP